MANIPTPTPIPIPSPAPISLQAICTKCNRLMPLEVCFECNQPLCRSCVVAHFEKWRYQKGSQCFEAESNVEACKRNMESVIPIINKNIDYVNQLRNQINKSYNDTLNKLNEEKKTLLDALNDVEKDNTKFRDFKKKVDDLGQSISSFKSPTENLQEDNMIKKLVTKYGDTFKTAEKLRQELTGLASMPIKAIESFDASAAQRPDLKLIGNIKTKESKLIVGNIGGGTNFEIWSQRAHAEPFLEIEFDKSPTYLASFRNYMFSVDDQGVLSVFTINSSFEMRNEKNIKMHFEPNSIACNMEYLAASYTNRKRIPERKITKTTGVSLYKRDLSNVDFNQEKVIELANEQFKNPIGVALNDDYLFVCDKDLKAVFKININTGLTVNRISIHGEPYKISVNQRHAVVTDILDHSINVYDSENMTLIKDVVIEQPDKRNGPYSVSITNDDLIAIKNYQDKQIILFNYDLTNHVIFKSSLIKSGILGFTILEGFDQNIVIGVAEKKGVYKLICYKNS